MTRVWVATSDPLTTRLAGPGIRAWSIASALAAAGHDVTLTTSAELDRRTADFVVQRLGPRPAELAARVDVVVAQGALLDEHPGLGDSEVVWVADMYDPVHLETLQAMSGADPVHRRFANRGRVASVDGQLLRADLVLCASPRQRDLWIGHLAALGRLNPASYDDDPTLRRLVTEVPFGLPDEPAVHRTNRVREVVPGIGRSDHVVLWGGGVYDWFDPLTLVRAVAIASERLHSLRLLFLGMRHPVAGESEAARRTRALADELGIAGRHVFFTDEWVPYDDRADVLLEADVAVSTHLEHVETAYAFRTRMLDYLWAGLPIVCTAGDAFADLVAAEDLGAVVPVGDAGALADALLRTLADPAPYAERVAAVRDRFRWSRALAPLVDFCAAPRRAPDLVDPVLGPRLRAARRRLGRQPTGWRGHADVGVQRYREGGWREVARRALPRR